MYTGTRVIAVAVLAILAACTTTQQMADSGFRPPGGDYRLVVMQPDITVSLLTAGGGLEPRADWTDQARENVIKALIAQQADRGGNVTVAATREQAGGDPQAVADLIRLHDAVGAAIMVHKYLNVPLPTKKDRFDWTLGQPAVDYGSAAQFDYALFLHAEDSFSSGGRVAVQIAGWLSCAVGVCVASPGGRQLAFASLVDLKSGNVVWFNILVSEVGDIRTPDGAAAMVDRLLDRMKPGRTVVPGKQG
ncbi:MAG: hypothetical protein IT480_02865 [Gammaproteobacteria bacterium]|nr:hypothetical protein [Gammaproteobacteria bacterium]